MRELNIRKIFFAGLILALLAHLSWAIMTTDPKLQPGILLIDFILIGLFAVSIRNIRYGFLASLLLLPFFFLLENISVISRVYQSQGDSFSLYTIDPRVIGFSLAYFFTLLMIFKNEKHFFQAPLSRVLPPVILYFCLSALWAVEGANTWVQISFYLLLSSLFFLAYFSTKSLESFYRLIFFLIGLSVPALLLSYYQLFSGLFYEYSDTDIKRISGPFDSPNLLGSFILFTSALAFILLLITKSNKLLLRYRHWLMFYLLTALPVLGMTFSRSAWLGALIFLGLFSLRKKSLFAGVLLGFSLLISLMLMFEPTRTRIDGFAERRMFDSMYARTNIWYLSHRKFMEKPWFGYGAGSFSTVINDAKESANGTDNPHNDFVFFSVEGGLLGVLGYILIIGSFYFYLIKYHRQFKNYDDTTLSLLSWGLISLFITFTVISLVESYYEGNFFHLFTWTTLGGWFGVAENASCQQKNS